MWQAYNNHYWPAHYLIDRSGQVVYTQFGEGDYDTTEHNIRVLLAAKGDKAKVPLSASEAERGQSPETYLGFSRQTGLINVANINILPLNSWTISDNWQTNAENILSKSPEARLRYHFYAGKVFLVIGSANGLPIDVNLKLGGKLIAAKESGKDVKNGILTVQEHRLYELVSLPEPTDATLEINASAEGLECYAFTFGS